MWFVEGPPSGGLVTSGADQHYLHCPGFISIKAALLLEAEAESPLHCEGLTGLEALLRPGSQVVTAAPGQIG
jgi:hypothetical protein